MWLQISLQHLPDHLKSFLGQLGLDKSVDKSIGGDEVWLQITLQHLPDHLTSFLGQFGLDESVDESMDQHLMRHRRSGLLQTAAATHTSVG